MLQTIAGFFILEQIAGIQQLGSGNVNDTFLVTLADSASLPGLRHATPEHRGVCTTRTGDAQSSPFSDHVEQKLAAQPPELTGRRWC